MGIPTRKVIRRAEDSITYPSETELEEWVKQMRVDLGPLLPKEYRHEVLKLLYLWKDLNSVGYEDLTPTDIIVHRVKIVPGTKPSSRKQIRWPRHIEWWMRKLIQDGIDGGVFERTGQDGQPLSEWNARIILGGIGLWNISNQAVRLGDFLKLIVKPINCKSQSHDSSTLGIKKFPGFFNFGSCFKLPMSFWRLSLLSK